MRSLRALETKAVKEARERRNKTILGLFIAAIMVFSTIGFVLWQRQPADQENVVKYNNYTFIKAERGWQTEVIMDRDNENLILETIYLPEELENITLDTKNKPSVSDFKNKVLYVVANDNEEQQAAYMLGQVLGQFVERMQYACSEQEADETFCLKNNLPIKSCEDAGMQTAIIIIEKNKEEEEIKTTISYEEGCLSIKGQGSELLKAAEKSIFVMLGIM